MVEEALGNRSGMVRADTPELANILKDAWPIESIEVGSKPALGIAGGGFVNVPKPDGWRQPSQEGLLRLGENYAAGWLQI